MELGVSLVGVLPEPLDDIGPLLDGVCVVPGVPQLAVSGKQRSAVAPDVPTFAEQGLPDYEASTWNCLFAPAATPPAVITRVNAALNKALAAPGVVNLLAKGASQPLGPSTPMQAEAYAQAQRARWVPFIRALQISQG